MWNSFLLRISGALLLTVLFFQINNLSFYFYKNPINNVEKKIDIEANSFEIVGEPTSISIPKINLEAKVIPVGKTISGNMDVPKNLMQTGWYKYGPKPGEIGNAVIDGHEVDQFGFGVIFRNLHRLNIGDRIVVKTIDGEIKNFQVMNIEVYNYKNAPLEKIFDESHSRNLNLITCEGKFVQSENTKNSRLVVYSTLIND